MIIYQSSSSTDHELKSSTCEPITAPTHVRRADMLVGGPVDIDPTQPEARDAIKFAVRTMNARSNAMYHSLPSNIISATSQVSHNQFI